MNGYKNYKDVNQIRFTKGTCINFEQKNSRLCIFFNGVFLLFWI